MSSRLKILAVCFGLAAVAVASTMLVDPQAVLAEAANRAGDATTWVQVHPLLSRGVFLGCATVGMLTPFPGAVVLMLVSGYLFGSIGGGVLSATGAALSAGVVCLGGRRLLAGFVARTLGRVQGQPGRAVTGDAFSALLALRLLPGMPAWLTNLIAVPMAIPLRSVLVVTWLGILPICLIAASVGDGVAALAAERVPLAAHMVLEARYAVPLAGLAVLAILPPLIRRAGAGGGLLMRLRRAIGARRAACARCGRTVMRGDRGPACDCLCEA